MGLILTSLEPLSRENVQTNGRHEVLEVYRDPEGHIVRFYVLITSHTRQADVAVLVDNRWSRLHHLLQVHTLEDSISRLFVAAAGMLDWPEAKNPEEGG